MSKKTTNALSLYVLKAVYSVEYGGPSRFIAALNDGTIDALIDDCATAMYGGDNTEVVKQLIKNCQDKVCRRKTRPVTNSASHNVDVMVDAFLEHLQTLRSLNASAKVNTVKYGKVTHEMTPEDIDKIDDLDIIEKVITDIGDYRSRHFSRSFYDEESATEEERAKKAQLDESIKYARKKRDEMKAAASKPVISDKLMGKLKGGSTTLSAAEVEELRKLLRG